MGYIQISHLYLGSKAIREKKLFNSLSIQTSERERCFLFRYSDILSNRGSVWALLESDYPLHSYRNLPQNFLLNFQGNETKDNDHHRCLHVSQAFQAF